jgi:serine/threonine protein kinase
MADHIGQRLGKYRLINLLGHGGYADVYLGEHIYIKTMAAIKVLHAQLEDEDVEKFRNEALMIAHLVHPHIVRVLDFDVDHYTPFLVMDYAPNGNLRSRHPKGTRVPPQIFLPYVKQVASALQYAHDQKLIHRDVKPENMLVGRNGEILLSDFGIALIAQSSHSQSTDQMVTGTVSYMSPEQIQGKPRPASDQYSLAVVVYEWLMGMKPFSGSYIEVVTQHLSSTPSSLHAQDASIPPSVEQVIFKALAKDHHQRFVRVQDFADALEQAYQNPQQQQSLRLPSQPLPVLSPLTASASHDMEAQPQPKVMAGQQVQIAPTLPVYAGRSAVTPRQRSEVVPPVRETQKRVTTSARKVGRGIRRGVAIVLALILLLGLLICGGGYTGYNYMVSHYFTQSGTANTAGAKAEADNFVQSVANRNYDQAYNDLSRQRTQETSRAQFKRNAQSEDSCYGPVTHFTGAGSTSQGSTLVYDYTITRSKLVNTYVLHISVQQNSAGNWQVADYTVDSGQPACG